MEENVKIIDKNSTNGLQKIEYVRPFDRSLDKDFHNRTESEKKMICHNRAMKAKVKDKIDRLKNEVDEREKEVATERKLRQEVETKLQASLQDMYSKKEVNQELRERLPRANKSDPFKTLINEESETDLSSIEEQIVEEEEESQASSKLNMEKEEKKEQEKKGKKSAKTRQHSPKPHQHSPKQSPEPSPKSSRRNLNFTGDTSPQTVGESPAGMERSSTGPFFNTSSPLRGFYGQPLGASPYMPYNGGVLPGTYHGLSPNFGNSLLYPTALSLPSPLQRPMTSSALYSSRHGDLRLPGQPLSQSVSAPTLTGAATLNTSPDYQTTTTTGATGGHSLNSSPDSGFGASTNIYGHYKPYNISERAGHTSVLPDPPVMTSVLSRLQHAGPWSSTGTLAARTSPDVDQNKHIDSLLNEIDLQRQETKRLKNELRDKDMELETLKLTLKTKQLDVNSQPSNVHSAADLVEEVYRAQKTRDEATVARMKIANEERDDIIARLHQLETRLDSQRDEGSFYMEQSDIELQLDDDQIENEDIMKKVEEMRQRQREVTQEEMQIVMEQRDVALAKCRKLEEELLRYQKERDADGGMDKSIKAKLAAIQQERDMAVAKSKQLDDEIQTLRICYSLHKSLTIENNNNKPSSNTVVTYQDELKVMKQELVAAQKENQHLVSQLRTTTIDKKQLEQALESVSLDKERLQRLADVLKRKLNKLADEALDDPQH